MNRSHQKYHLTGVGTGGSGGPAPHPEKREPAPYLPPPPTFHGSPLSALPSVYQFISCHTLGSTALALVCVRSHFRVLENEKFSTHCEGNPSHTLLNSVAPLPRICAPPPHTFKYIATPMHLDLHDFIVEISKIIIFLLKLQSWILLMHLPITDKPRPNCCSFIIKL